MMKLNRTYAPKALSKTNKEFKTAIAGMNTKEAYDFYKSHKRKYCYNTAETKLHFRKMNQERCSFCTKLIQDFDDAMTVEHNQLKKIIQRRYFNGATYYALVQHAIPKEAHARTILQNIWILPK